uniref:Uncharacterized protein n=1 Tax=Aegilops tauschii subsp. strangulata TaxID=200361 RepID=A0A453M8A5_AEGTS
GLAVQAFRREEESAKTLKRRRDRIEQPRFREAKASSILSLSSTE